MENNDHCNSGLYALKVLPLDNVVEDLLAFDTLSKLDKSPFEQYRVIINDAYGQASRRTRDTCLYENVRIVGCRKNWNQTDFRLLPLERERKAKNDRLINC